jgi:hypothetical protein
MDSRPTNEERLATAHAALTDAVASITTTEDWQNLLRISGSFHRYSPNNQLLLAAQGAEGLVASFHTWKQITATDGQPCRIRKGETALRVYAPIRGQQRELDEDTGELRPAAVVGYRLVPVFHQGQLAAPPDLPAQPKLLSGEDPPPEIWAATAEQISAAGFTLQRGPIEGPDGPKGVTNFLEKTVTVRDDLGPAQSLKTQIHELGHVLMHADAEEERTTARDRIEVEAESVAYVVCDILGVDAGEYSIPYVANWAGADVQLVQDTAHRVLATARTIVAGLENELGVDLRPNPIAEAMNANRQPEPPPPLGLHVGTTDQLIVDHLSTGRFNWQRLAASIPALEPERARGLDSRPDGQAVVLAESGASACATLLVLRAQGLADDAAGVILSASVPDSLGTQSKLFSREEVEAAIRSPDAVKPVAESIYADLLVSVGRHPTAVRQLAETSGAPAEVIALAEERARRRHRAVERDGRDRGVRLIEDWSAPVASLANPVEAQVPPPPEPPAA